MTQRVKQFGLLLGALLLGACGPLVIRDAALDGYRPIQGGHLELHRAIEVPTGRTRVFFQDGELVTGINEFRPHCQLEVERVAESIQRIEPDRFDITRVSTRSDQVVMAVPDSLAAVGIGIGIGIGAGGWGAGETRRMYVYLFGLHSDRQPDVRQLTCGGAFDDPHLARRPTLQEIAAALGPYATLTLH